MNNLAGQNNLISCLETIKLMNGEGVADSSDVSRTENCEFRTLTLFLLTWLRHIFVEGVNIHELVFTESTAHIPTLM